MVSLLTPEQQQVKAYAERWIAQFEGSALRGATFKNEFESTFPLMTDEMPICVTVTFGVPLHSRGNTFIVQFSCLPELLMFATRMALREQEQTYLSMDIHNNLKFTPMEADGGN